MARDDADFAAYLAARWTPLVRTVVLLGCPQPDAERVARSGLAACCHDWTRVRREEDVDVHVHRAVLAALASWRRHRHDEPDARDLQREAMVLRVVTDLAEVQIAEVLDVPTTVGGRSRADDPAATGLRDAAAEIDVLPPDLDAIVAEARARRGRRRRQALIAVAVAVVLVAGLTWWGSRSGPDDLGPLPVTPVANPVDVAWWAAGTLHLDRVTLEVPSVTSLVEVGDGAVYVDDEGAVIYVDERGDRSALGQTRPGVPVVASRSEGIVAWVGPGDELEAYSVSQDTRLGRIEVPEHSRPIAVSDGRVYYGEPGRTAAFWQPADGLVASLDRRGLLAISSTARVFQDGRRLQLLLPLFSVDHRQPGEGAQLSDGGNYVLSRRPGDPADGFTPLLYEMRTGTTLSTGVAPFELVVDATFGASHSIVYLVSRPGESLLLLRTCRIGGDCADVAPVPVSDDPPLLAR